jgi:putative ABC transport system substrate-binding protein
MIAAMKRREFITLLGGAAAWPLAARAEQQEGVRRIAVLIGVAGDSETKGWVSVFRKRLDELGWRVGGNLQIEERWTAGDPDRNRRFASELLAMRPDAVFAFSSVAVAALQQESPTVPIVFTAISDPVGSGFVESLARPGRNATGFTNFVPTMAAKWLEVLKEIAPQVQRAVLLFNPQTAPYVGQYYQRPFEAAAPSFGVRAIAAVVHTTGEIEAAIANTAREPGGGLVVPRLRASGRDEGRIMIRSSSPLTMLLSRHTRRRDFITLLWRRDGVAARDMGAAAVDAGDRTAQQPFARCRHGGRNLRIDYF